ncbi:hypothetical protein HF325_003268 [Metschnikowia pulcherrima]|uniref:Uncharacterized protein n=1 Tax=Metschnikowia pulcherrima TaxID=27326 RepID=A0A8H7GV56_9ASCO|nr:hypothetical protein HF325_003268 [Metschnikowia pulcherrima]
MSSTSREREFIDSSLPNDENRKTSTGEIVAAEPVAVNSSLVYSHNPPQVLGALLVMENVPSVLVNNNIAPVNEPAVPFDNIIDQALLVDLKKESPWIAHGAPDAPKFIAAYYASSLWEQWTPPSYDDWLPEKFHYEKAHMIPELYFIFREKFASQGEIHYEYIKRSLDGFRKCFHGSEEHINSIICGLNMQFDLSFRLCIDKSDEFIKTALGNPGKYDVEQSTIPEVLKFYLPMKAYVHENELMRRAIGGDVEPLVVAMQASKRSYHDIWNHICSLLLAIDRDPTELVTFERLMERYRSRSISVKIDLRHFVAALLEHNFFGKTFRKSPPTKPGNSNGQPITDKSSQKNGGNSNEHPTINKPFQSGHSGKKTASKVGKPIKFKPNGEPFLPRKEYVKKMREERMKKLSEERMNESSIKNEGEGY